MSDHALTTPPPTESAHTLLSAAAARFPSFTMMKPRKMTMSQVEGQVNLRDAARRDISYVSPETGKHYGLAEGAKLAVLLVRPRGWHLDEAHVTVDGR